MYRYFFIFLLLIACSSNESHPQIEEQTDTNKAAELPYFELAASDSNFILEFRTVLAPINEMEVYSTISDKIKNILVKQWQLVKQGDYLIAYSSDKQSEFEQIIKNYESEKAKYAAAKAKFEDEEISKQEYENARTTYTLSQKKYFAIKDKIALTAPMNGIVSAVLASKGKAVSVGQVLFKIANIDTLSSIFIIDDEASKYINNKLIPEINIKNEILKGKIDKICKTPNAEEYELHLTFPNTDHKLNIWDSVSIHIDTKRKYQQILIPKNTVFVEGEDTFVTLFLDGGTQKKVKVKLGDILGEQIQVLSGLKPGDKLILR